MADDADLLHDIRSHAREAIAILDGVSLPAFEADRVRRLATERLLEIIGEAANLLSAEARDTIEHDWQALRGLRNRLAHQYRRIRAPLLYRAVKDKLPDLVKSIDEAAEQTP